MTCIPRVLSWPPHRGTPIERPNLCTTYQLIAVRLITSDVTPLSSAHTYRAHVHACDTCDVPRSADPYGHMPCMLVCVKSLPLLTHAWCTYMHDIDVVKFVCLNPHTPARTLPQYLYKCQISAPGISTSAQTNKWKYTSHTCDVYAYVLHHTRHDAPHLSLLSYLSHKCLTMSIMPEGTGGSRLALG
jgi:hypothetical protein